MGGSYLQFLRAWAVEISAATLIGVAALGGLSYWYVTTPKVGEMPPERIPEMVLPTFDGELVDIADPDAPVRIYVVWASWCTVCVDTLNGAVHAAKEYPGDVSVYAVNRKEHREEAEAYLERIGLRQSVVILADEDDEFYGKVEGYAMPEVLFVNDDNETLFHERGPLTLDTIKSHIEKMLE